MGVSYGARWLPRNRMCGVRRSVGSNCPARARPTPSAGGDLHDRRLHGYRAGSDVVGVEPTEANPGSPAVRLIPGRGSCTILKWYQVSEMTVIVCISAVTVPVRGMIAQPVPIGSRWRIMRLLPGCICSAAIRARSTFSSAQLPAHRIDGSDVDGRPRRQYRA